MHCVINVSWCGERAARIVVIILILFSEIWLSCVWWASAQVHDLSLFQKNNCYRMSRHLFSQRTVISHVSQFYTCGNPASILQIFIHREAVATQKKSHSISSILAGLPWYLFPFPRDSRNASFRPRGNPADFAGFPSYTSPSRSLQLVLQSNIHALNY